MVMIHKGQDPKHFNDVNYFLFEWTSDSRDEEEFCFYQTLLELISDTCHESVLLDKHSDGGYRLHTCSMEEVFQDRKDITKAIGRLAIRIIERANTDESYGC